jgi:hypothetical protein
LSTGIEITNSTHNKILVKALLLELIDTAGNIISLASFMGKHSLTDF